MLRWPIVMAGLAALLTAPAAAVSQVADPDSVDVTGVVGDVATGRPISTALVELPELDRRTITTTDGRFVFLDVPAGPGLIRVEALGYVTWEEETELRHLDLLRIGLLPQPIVLENIRVLADRLERRRKAAAVSVYALDRREMLRSGSGTAASLVRSRMPNITRSCTGLTGGSMYVRPETDLSSAADPLSLCIMSRGRLFRPNVFIDDVSVPFAMLWAYNTAELYAVEIYSGGRTIRVYTTWYLESGRTLRPRLPGWP